MLTHITELFQSYQNALAGRGDRSAWDVFQALRDSIAALDEGMIAPASRTEFLMTRAMLKGIVSHGFDPRQQEISARLKELVTFEYGPFALSGGRTFRWLTDPDLRKIVERDFGELVALVLPAGAWKSAVILAGSVAEAILFDLIVRDHNRKAAAQPHWPQWRGQPKTEDYLVLGDLIPMALALGLIDIDRSNTFDVVLREYRNFVHPKKEIRVAHPCGEGEAFMARGALTALCDHFDRVL